MLIDAGEIDKALRDTFPGGAQFAINTNEHGVHFSIAARDSNGDWVSVGWVYTHRGMIHSTFAIFKNEFYDNVRRLRANLVASLGASSDTTCIQSSKIINFQEAFKRLRKFNPTEPPF